MLKKHCFNGYKRAVFQTLPKTGGVVLSYFTGGEKMNDSKKKPCSKCPYALGLVHTVTNPCPKCELNGYQSYEWFQKQLSGDSSISQKEK
jgi:hypothetical protein